jgi:hypothetical protein
MLRMILALVVGFGALSLVGMADDKEKKLEGKLQCTKCSLSETDKCGNALVVKEDGKDVTYYLKDKGAKMKYHAKICQEPKDATVTGKIEEKDGKKYIIVTEEKQVEFK